MSMSRFSSFDPRSLGRLARVMDQIMSPMSQSMSQMQRLQDQLLRSDPFIARHLARRPTVPQWRQHELANKTATSSATNQAQQIPSRASQQMTNQPTSSSSASSSSSSPVVNKKQNNAQLNRWDPFWPLDDFWAPFGTNNSLSNFGNFNFPNQLDFKPTLNVTESKDNFALNFNLPGVKKEEVKISIDGADHEKVLTVSGERRHELKEEKDDEGFVRIEEGYGKFTRSISLPENVDTSNLKARFEDGVLKLVVPKVTPVVEPPAPKSQPVPIE